MKVGKFEIYKDKRGEYRFRFIAANGKPMLHSEGFTTKEYCKDLIKKIQYIVNDAEIVDLTR